MKLLVSIFSFLVSPVLIRFAEISAKLNKSEQFKYNGVEIWCPNEQKKMVKTALDEVRNFFHKEWSVYEKNIKKIIITPGVDTVALIAKRSVIIRESDVSRMSSSTHFAGWLVADYAAIRSYKDYYCGVIAWNPQVFSRADTSALAMRKKYLERGQPFDRCVEENPSTTPPPPGPESGGGSEEIND